jgi:hypothetical protein
LAETALNHGLDPDAPAEYEQAVVHVDAEVLADRTPPRQSVFENGTHVPAGTSQRRACDTSRVVIRHDTRRAGGQKSGPARAQRAPVPGNVGWISRSVDHGTSPLTIARRN